ncbi:hypothetical protein N7468_010201 [Penicillium chermesinum]|uniref:Uncharacterized protein n=1 Tax=Penicillium chermesinum TaxID=63820 RepID=A0A9W9NE76_9EURO|nr:uncharacterized protein N7468_010201 [Penicillium chermesinum]KAJ5217193.1 hypothetical protein N7468_010201 [Penicillium chermesinum]
MKRPKFLKPVWNNLAWVTQLSNTPSIASYVGTWAMSFQKLKALYSEFGTSLSRNETSKTNVQNVGSIN